jgi:Mrp family chromosome partitioning ATPase
MGLGDGHRLVYMLRREWKTASIVQLIAARSGEGTSSVTRDLALAAALMPGLRVLLLDLDTPGDGQISALRHGSGLAVTASRALARAPGAVVAHQLAGANLYVSETAPPGAGGAGWADAFACLREDFELVLIDSPALERRHDGIMLARDVDTNLLVVEAERTRAAEARGLRDHIVDVGGVIGGVVLNQRRCHIPDLVLRHV